MKIKLMHVVFALPAHGDHEQAFDALSDLCDDNPAFTEWGVTPDPKGKADAFGPSRLPIKVYKVTKRIQDTFQSPRVRRDIPDPAESP